MSLAAQFYENHHATDDRGPSGHGWRSRGRELYSAGHPHHETASSEYYDDREQSRAQHYTNGLAQRYRGAGASSIPRVDDLSDDGEMLMTDAERARFANELDALEHLEAQQRRRDAPRPASNTARPTAPPSAHQQPNTSRATTDRYATSLREHFDPHLLSDASLPSTLMPRSYAAAMESLTPRDAFFDKNERWRDHVEQKNAILRDALKGQSDVECTFRPNINHSRSPNASRVDHNNQQRRRNNNVDDGGDAPAYEGRNGVRRHTEMDVTTRLFQFEQQRKRRLELRTTERQNEVDEKCTFRPKTIKREWTANVMPRYLDDPKAVHTTSPQNAPGDAEGNDAQNRRSGHPDTNQSILGADPSIWLESYLHTPVHDRLHRSAVVSMERKRRQEEARRSAAGGRISSRDTTQGAPSFTVGETTLSSIGEHTAIMEQGAQTAQRAPSEEFFRRMEVAQTIREDKLRQIREEESMHCTFRPVTAVYRRSPDDVAVDSKQDQKKKRDAASHSATQQPTFTPRIDKRSARIVSHRSVDDLLKYDQCRVQKINRLREESMQDAADGEEQYAFSPRISRFAQSVEGKIAQSTRSIDDYKRFVAMQRRIRQRDVELHIREREEQEDRELTFRPEVHEAPSYIHEIVRELKESRAASASVRSRSRNTEN